MKKIFVLQFIFTALLSIAGKNVTAQGCVAVRSNGAMCTMSHADSEDDHKWQLTTGYRYFHSFRHFVGTDEQKHRVDEGTDVRNWQ
ncbi:MAG TPA: hypothetical protein VL946_07100, partial [Lacibacter sp.]|nr:hypothetical protein [Lacibacter sp.]